MRLIFLDVDGVLNDTPHGGVIGHRQLQILSDVVESTGACVVLSSTSSWRADPSAYAAWYAEVLNDPRTARVLTGESSMGPFKQYFIEEP